MVDAVITWISGPVMRARTSRQLHVSEAVVVGADRLLGEVIRVDGDDIVAQIYEDTTGLRPGDQLEATGQRLSIRLRPGLLGNIFDGLLRPLSDMPGDTVLPGMREAAQQTFAFEPSRLSGEHVAAGAAIGAVTGGSVREQVLTPPDTGGVIVSIVEAGDYADDATLCVLRDEGGGEHAPLEVALHGASSRAAGSGGNAAARAAMYSLVSGQVVAWCSPRRTSTRSWVGSMMIT